MRQSIHIFLKDTRYLRIEICLFVVFAAIFAWSGARSSNRQAGSEYLVEIAAIYLIARVIHAESIPGDRQFWLTRPYSRMSLAGAKLLFIVAFVCGPICAAQIVMLAAGGFPILDSIPGLVWSQALIFFVGSMFMAALAAVTSGTVIFMLAVLLLAAAALIGQAISLFYPAQALLYAPQELFALEWVRQYCTLAILGLTAAFVLFWQYRNRATIFSRAAGIGGIAVATALFFFIPPSVVLGVQLWLPGRPAGNSVQVSIDPESKDKGAAFSGGRDPMYRRVRIPLPITVRGLSEGVEARVDAISLSFEWPENRQWTPDLPPGLNPRSNMPGVSTTDATVLMEPTLYWNNRNSPLTMTGTAYVTLFGDTQTRTVALQDGPVNVQDGLQCLMGEFNLLLCRSFFRWPARLVYAQSAGTRYEFRNSMISYSPFPANAGVNLMETRSGGELKSREVTVITRKPVAHFRRQVQIRGLTLLDFEGHEPPIPQSPPPRLPLRQDRE